MTIFKWKIFPLVVIVFLILAYAWSNAVFVNCLESLTVCEPIASENLSEVPFYEKNNFVGKQENNELHEDVNCEEVSAEKPVAKHHLKCIPNQLALKKNELKIKNERIQNQRQAIDLVSNKLNEINKILSPEDLNSMKNPNEKSNLSGTGKAITTTSDAIPKPTDNGLKAEKEKLEDLIKSQNETLTTLENDSKKKFAETAVIRRQISERYSKRMLFMFFTAAFLLLCIAAVVISIFVIKESLDPLERKANSRASETDGEKGSLTEKIVGILINWRQIIVAIIAVGFGLAVYFFYEEKYLSIVIPMYSQTIWFNGDVSQNLVHSVNCIGFSATIWLVFAGSAVYYAVRSKSQGLITYISSRQIKLTAEKAELEQERANQLLNDDIAAVTDLDNKITQKKAKIVELAARLKNKFEVDRRLITAILYIGAMMLFIGMVRIKLLADWHLLFISLDASNPFYFLLADFFNKSIGIQAAFYSLLLLVIYVPVIYSIPGMMDSPAPAGKNFLERLGLPFSSEFIKKFVAIFSPVLAGPIVEFFNFIINKAG